MRTNETTHYSVVDKDGNAVSITYTINNNFGANVIAGDTGFFLNDEMDDFTSKVGAPNLFGLIQGKNNAIEPGKRPLSSMSPSIVTKDGKIFMVIGSPDGSRIITITLEAMHERDRPQYEYPGGDQLSPHPSAMDAGRGLSGERRIGARCAKSN